MSYKSAWLLFLQFGAKLWREQNSEEYKTEEFRIKKKKKRKKELVLDLIIGLVH